MDLNIGMNCGIASGQTVMQFHCHLIPRYTGDLKTKGEGVRHSVVGKDIINKKPTLSGFSIHHHRIHLYLNIYTNWLHLNSGGKQSQHISHYKYHNNAYLLIHIL
jgi:hypothetical protein